MIILDDGSKKLDFRKMGYEIQWEHENQGQPEITHNTKKVPGRIGLIKFGSQLNERYFKMTVIIPNLSLGNVDKLVDEINAFLFDASFNMKRVKAHIDYEDKWRYVELAGAIKPDLGGDFNRIEIPFVSFDPLKYKAWNGYDTSGSVYYDKVESGDRYKSESTIDLKNRRQYFGIDNPSSVTIDMRTTITGSFTGGILRIRASDGKYGYLSTTHTLPDLPSGTMVIDSKTSTIKINGNLVDIGNGNFLKIKPGTNSFMFESEKRSGTLKSEWEYKFL